MSGHTPGPWEVNPLYSEILPGHVAIDAPDAGRYLLAQVVWVMDDDAKAKRNSPECEANARLIAEAPTMFRELRTACSALKSAARSNAWQNERDRIVGEIETIIKRIEGGA